MPHGSGSLSTPVPEDHHAEDSSLESFSFGALAQCGLEPDVDATRPDAQTTAYRPTENIGAMLSDKRLLHLASQAQYAVATFDMSRVCVTRTKSRFSRRMSTA